MKILSISLLLLLSPLAHAKNVIFFIADGLGSSGITLARHEQRIRQGKSSLFLDQLQQTALIKTSSFDHLVTDSAAAGTALACGKKTKNKMIGMGPNEEPLQSILKKAKEMGKSVGIVTTASIVDATPAAFYAQTPDRANKSQIAQQLLESHIDLALGGGYNQFINLKYRIKNDYIHFKDFRKLQGRNINRPILGLFAEDNLSFIKQRPNTSIEPTLKQMTDFAISHLAKNPKGFFLIIEAGLIDYAAHQNLLFEYVEEVLDYDQAIGNALEQIKNNPVLRNETLLLATSDHETAGLSINGYTHIGLSPLEASSTFTGVTYDIATFTTGPKSKLPTRIAVHTGTDVPAYAYGKNATKVHGTMENSDLYPIMLETLTPSDDK